jgi:hypothetical protein
MIKNYLDEKTEIFTSGFQIINRSFVVGDGKR